MNIISAQFVHIFMNYPAYSNVHPNNTQTALEMEFTLIEIL